MNHKKISTYIDRNGTIQQHEHPVKPVQASEKESVLGSSKYMNVGFYLLVPLLLGLGIGLFIDSQFKTKPLGTLAGIFLGLISSFYNLYKLVQDENTGNKH